MSLQPAKAVAAFRREEKADRNKKFSSAEELRPGPAVQKGCLRLYGGLDNPGVSMELHDFQRTDPCEWSDSFHPDSLELCLNLRGRGKVRCGEDVLNLEPSTAGFYFTGIHALQAWRLDKERHHFITISFSRGFLRAQLSQSDGGLHPLVETFLSGRPCSSNLGAIHQLTMQQELRTVSLLHPPAAQAGRMLWYHSQILQWMVEFLFERPGEDELFCDRQKRLARDRVDRTISVLQSCLADPPSLEEIGHRVGCSPYHLSRTFSREMGMTIPQYLRRLRMERAVELLKTGKYNVTEVALEVGYSSLSHFSQVFCQTTGSCPGLFSLRNPV